MLIGLLASLVPSRELHYYIVYLHNCLTATIRCQGVFLLRGRQWISLIEHEKQNVTGRNSQVVLLPYVLVLFKEYIILYSNRCHLVSTIFTILVVLATFGHDPSCKAVIDGDSMVLVVRPIGGVDSTFVSTYGRHICEETLFALLYSTHALVHWYESWGSTFLPPPHMLTFPCVSASPFCTYVLSAVSHIRRQYRTAEGQKSWPERKSVCSIADFVGRLHRGIDRFESCLRIPIERTGAMFVYLSFVWWADTARRRNQPCFECHASDSLYGKFFIVCSWT